MTQKHIIALALYILGAIVSFLAHAKVREIDEAKKYAEDISKDVPFVTAKGLLIFAYTAVALMSTVWPLTLIIIDTPDIIKSYVIGGKE